MTIEVYLLVSNLAACAIAYLFYRQYRQFQEIADAWCNKYLDLRNRQFEELNATLRRLRWPTNSFPPADDDGPCPQGTHKWKVVELVSTPDQPPGERVCYCDVCGMERINDDD
jgi:hypothetical protein